MHLQGFSISPKWVVKGLRGPRINSVGKTKHTSGGGGGVTFTGVKGMCPLPPSPLSSFEIHRPCRGPQMGPHETMQMDGVWCASSQIWPKFRFREILGENPADIHIWPPITGLVGSWISLTVLLEGALHVCEPHQFSPLRSECCGRGAPTNVVCAECMKCVVLGGRVR